MADTVRFSWDDAPVGPVRLRVPPEGQLEEHLTHIGCSASQIAEEIMEHYGAEEAAEILAEEDLDLSTPGFVHPVWWADPANCPANDDPEKSCRCGRFTLTEVLSWMEDPELRQQAIEAHQQVMTEAFDHYWSGDAFYYEHLDAIGAICSACFTDGEGHISQVGGEAESLAEELGSAIAAHHTKVWLGEKRYHPNKE